MEKINIAIDGYSSCGKSTLAKALAKELEYVYIDTGAMYRAVTLFAINQGLFEDELNKAGLIEALPQVNIDFEYDPETEASQTLLNGVQVEQEIRTMAVSGKVSPVSAIPEVRRKLVALQQQIGEQGGVVMDGRDIGTVVFPNAALKIFMTADPEIRAMRRFQELERKGKPADLNEVRKNLEERDYIDTHRETDPLRKADDAQVLDNSHLSQAEQLELALSWAQERISVIS